MDYLRSFTNRKRLQEALPIIITGTDTIENTMTMRLKNIYNCIIKPFDFFEFQDKLSYALQNKGKE
jgi:DNA-binding NtrC family response regulator